MSYYFLMRSVWFTWRQHPFAVTGEGILFSTTEMNSFSLISAFYAFLTFRIPKHINTPTH